MAHPTFLDALLKTPGTSGEEADIQDLCRRRLAHHVSTITRDTHGNQFYVLNGDASPRVMITAHVDQIGFMVKSIDPKGFVRVCAVGGVDAATVDAQRVLVHGPAGAIPGVIGRRPLPFQTDDERKKAIEVHDLWIDIGARTREEALPVAPIGSSITFDTPVTPLLNGRIAAHALDNRIGVYILMEVLRELARRMPQVCVVGVTTVQEEVGLRGATTAAWGQAPDIGINLDVNFATDHPQGEPERYGDTRLSEGPILGKGPGSAPTLVDQLEAVARTKHIPFQVRAEPEAGGTDAGAVQVSRGGVAVADIGIPNRYMHSPVEVVCLEDARQTIQLLTSWAIGLRGR